MVTAAAAVPTVDHAEQLARAEQKARIAERNAAIAAQGAAQRLATCPWGGDAETASTASSRQPSSRKPSSTCPWGADGDEVPSSKPRKMITKDTRDTCPWSSSANDKDSVRLADAERRRQRPSPSNFGRAGAGAPKPPPQMFPRTEPADAAQPAMAQREAVDVTQKLEPCPQPAAVAGDIDEEEQDREEQREIIQQCLAEGLSEERILELLEEWQNEKLIRQTQERMQREQGQSMAAAQPSVAASRNAGPQPDALGLGVCGASVAATRQAKASKALSFGPSDQEIVGVLNEYTKENMTPPDSPPNAVSLAAKRAKDRQPSEASVGSFNTDKSRAAYLQSKNQAEAVKNKQRMGPGIF